MVSNEEQIQNLDLVRARIDEHIKEEASAVLATMGLTVSDAFRMLLTRVAREKALPFDPLAADDATIAAVKQARRRGQNNTAPLPIQPDRGPNVDR